MSPPSKLGSPEGSSDRPPGPASSTLTDRVASQPFPLGSWPRRLLAIFALGALGTGSELLLLGHTENLLQWQPVVLCGVALVASALHAATRWRSTRRLLEGLSWLFVASGCTGLWQHYRSNAEFELEMDPGLAGLDLFAAAARGATPFLAPGAMILLGLLGLLYASATPTSTTRWASDADRLPKPEARPTENSEPPTNR